MDARSAPGDPLSFAAPSSRPERVRGRLLHHRARLAQDRDQAVQHGVRVREPAPQGERPAQHGQAVGGVEPHGRRHRPGRENESADDLGGGGIGNRRARPLDEGGERQRGALLLDDRPAERPGVVRIHQVEAQHRLHRGSLHGRVRVGEQRRERRRRLEVPRLPEQHERADPRARVGALQPCNHGFKRHVLRERRRGHERRGQGHRGQQEGPRGHRVCHAIAPRSSTRRPDVSTSRRYRPVCEPVTVAISSGVPVATTRPPSSPPSGPRSMM